MIASWVNKKTVAVSSVLVKGIDEIITVILYGTVSREPPLRKILSCLWWLVEW